jgi:DNA modification methylase
MNPRELKPHPKNPNRHSPAQIDRLIKLIKAYGWRHPIIVSNQTGFVIVGHGRLEAAIKMKESTVPVNHQDFKDEEEEYGFMVADNAIAGWADLDLASINLVLPELGPDFDVDLFGIKDFVLEPADKYGDKDADEVPENRRTDIKIGDLWALGNHRLLCGDSTNRLCVARLLDGEKAELCFTSPPYGDQREYNKKDLNLDIEHISKFITASSEHVNYWAVVLGTMRKDGEVFTYWDTFIKTARDAGLKLISWNIWNKMNDALMFTFNQMFAVNHEWIFVFGRESKKLIPTVRNQHAGEINDHVSVRVKDGRIKKQDTVKIREFSQLRTIIDCTPQKARNNDFDHPAMFCVELPEKYIEAFVVKDGLVYEPFSGSGTTLIACEKTNRKCFGMEIDPQYCQVIIDRWEKFTGQKAVKIE